MLIELCYREIEKSFAIDKSPDMLVNIQFHENSVAEYMMEFAKFLGMDTFMQDRLAKYAQCHDIGKFGIPQSIVLKPGKLTEEEYEVMKHHTEFGSSYIRCLEELHGLEELVLHHHEWWDGTGYPSGMRAEDIPLECRILAIVDAFDAMTGHRCYRDSVTANEALLELRRNAGIQFDPVLVDQFDDFFHDQWSIRLTDAHRALELS